MTDSDDTADFDIVVADPAHYYAAPSDILADAELTLDQKIRLLEEWEIDLRRTLESDSEGMAQGSAATVFAENRSADDSRRLRQVSNHLRIARGEEKSEPFVSAPKTVVGRMWHRLFGKPLAA
jgi:hypothetical protein